MQAVEMLQIEESRIVEYPSWDLFFAQTKTSDMSLIVASYTIPITAIRISIPFHELRRQILIKFEAVLLLNQQILLVAKTLVRNHKRIEANERSREYKKLKKVKFSLE